MLYNVHVCDKHFVSFIKRKILLTMLCDNSYKYKCLLYFCINMSECI